MCITLCRNCTGNNIVYDKILMIGTPGGTRTPDLMVRSHALYPAELRVRVTEVLYHDVPAQAIVCLPAVVREVVESGLDTSE